MTILHILSRTARDLRAYLTGGGIRFAPFTQDLAGYDSGKFRADSWAAANVTLLALAQSLAFAAIAGLPVVFGIISTAVAAFVAPLFAGSRHTVMGPTNATAFMLLSFFSVNPDLAHAPAS